MNKKAYMQPVSAESVVSMEQLICASPDATPQVGGTTDNVDDLLSRRANHSIWEDEDFDEGEDF